MFAIMLKIPSVMLMCVTFSGARRLVPHNSQLLLLHMLLHERLLPLISQFLEWRSVSFYYGSCVYFRDDPLTMFVFVRVFVKTTLDSRTLSESGIKADSCV